MKIKTAEATKLQLDWGVAEVMRLEPELAFHECYRYGVAVLARPSLKSVKGLKQGFSHTDPAVCMALTAHLHIMQQSSDSSWRVAGRRQDSSHAICAVGKTLAEAVARCVILKVLGEYFECPDELGVQL